LGEDLTDFFPRILTENLGEDLTDFFPRILTENLGEDLTDFFHKIFSVLAHSYTKLLLTDTASTTSCIYKLQISFINAIRNLLSSTDGLSLLSRN